MPEDDEVLGRSEDHGSGSDADESMARNAPYTVSAVDECRTTSRLLKQDQKKALKRARSKNSRKEKATVEELETRTGGYVVQESRAMSGAFAGNGGQWHTCLPDAITTALVMCGVDVDKGAVRHMIFPAWKDIHAPGPSVAAAASYLRAEHGLSLTPQSHMCSNPFNLFSMPRAPKLHVYIAELLLEGVQKHFAVFNTATGLFGDNQPHVVPIKIEESDLKGGNATAIRAMLALWGVAYETATLVNA